MEYLLQALTRDRGRLLFYSFVLTSILNIYNLANYEISVDDEVNPLGGVAVASWFFSIGRWGAALLAAIAPHPFVVPFSTNIIFCASISVAYVVLCDMHSIRKAWKALILLPIFAVFPSWAFIEAFYNMLPAISLGLLFTVMAAYLGKGIVSGDCAVPWAHAVAIVLLLATATGCYQSFVLLFAGIGLGWPLVRCCSGSIEFDLTNIKRLLFVYLGLAVIAVAASLLLGKVYQTAFDVEPSSYLSQMLPVEDSWFGKVGSSVVRLKNEASGYYFGSSNVYGYRFAGLTGLFWLSLIALFMLRTSWAGFLVALLLWLLLIVSPFAFTLLGGGLPARSLLSLPYVVWVMSVLVVISARRLGRRRFHAVVTSVVLFTINLQIVAINGAYAAASFLANRHDSNLASQVYGRLVDLGAFDNGAKHIVLGVKGAVNYGSIFPAGLSSTLDASIFDWDGGNPRRIIGLMRLLGYSRVEMMPSDELSKIKARFDAMEPWPSKGSILHLGTNRYLLKFGTD